MCIRDRQSTWGDESNFMAMADIQPKNTRRFIVEWKDNEQLYLTLRNLDYHHEVLDIKLHQRTIKPDLYFFEIGGLGFLFTGILFLAALVATVVRVAAERKVKKPKNSTSEWSLEIVTGSRYSPDNLEA
eukprot:TRINITY_DN25433_c0_g2_i1.p1 TRINITY_DN25433_c0_g2~~TRINITY_DN25433_c0_g2_i1.p1  ORF type:complete len:129 (-),score=21.93 TRINITY_DN25433_c0_g2_i1:101-487(-)